MYTAKAFTFFLLFTEKNNNSSLSRLSMFIPFSPRSLQPFLFKGNGCIFSLLFAALLTAVLSALFSVSVLEFGLILRFFGSVLTALLSALVTALFVTVRPVLMVYIQKTAFNAAFQALSVRPGRRTAARRIVSVGDGSQPSGTAPNHRGRLPADDNTCTRFSIFLPLSLRHDSALLITHRLSDTVHPGVKVLSLIP